MSQLFIPDGSGEWAVLPLESDRYRLAGNPRVGPKIPRVSEQRGGRLSPKAALLVRRAAGSEEAAAAVTSAEWAVVAGSDARIRVNGVALATGMAALRHRDELRVGGTAPLYFSSERLAAVERYTAADSPRCPRCTLPIEEGEPYVRCPGCGVLHHQLPDRECWTYTATCALCDHSSDLDAGLRWSPEGL